MGSEREDEHGWVDAHSNELNDVLVPAPAETLHLAAKHRRGHRFLGGCGGGDGLDGDVHAEEGAKTHDSKAAATELAAELDVSSVEHPFGVVGDFGCSRGRLGETYGRSRRCCRHSSWLKPWCRFGAWLGQGLGGKVNVNVKHV